MHDYANRCALGLSSGNPSSRITVQRLWYRMDSRRSVPFAFREVKHLHIFQLYSGLKHSISQSYPWDSFVKNRRSTVDQTRNIRKHICKGPAEK